MPAARRERALDAPGFGPLLAAAGGAGQVEPFCQDLVPDADPDGKPETDPARPSSGTGDDGGRNPGRGG
ncbi:hypothetical protein [Micromonospora olivasterospora]|uniref:Uncharacterized protein n=2 Tax=Micromonospora olivasterospora TaxID=1880 RepID=A0A562IFR9_MICOL|nr:hypothetical protein [Micromonospora olivasterospora]TWH69847.1 hypothetical protein JD77_04861 [Micromonospora olivasterospora]